MAEKLEVIFFKTASGKQPVREWLLRLTKSERAVIGANIKTVQYGWPVGEPLVKNLGKGLWEVRCSLNRKKARVIFCFADDKIILLHGFIKKTQKTPQQELVLARDRQRLYQSTRH